MLPQNFKSLANAEVLEVDQRLMGTSRCVKNELQRSSGKLGANLIQLTQISHVETAFALAAIAGCDRAKPRAGHMVSLRIGVHGLTPVSKQAALNASLMAFNIVLVDHNGTTIREVPIPRRRAVALRMMRPS